MDMKVYVTFLIKMLMKHRMNPFYKYEFKNKIKLFSHNKKKFKLKHRTVLFHVNLDCSVIN